MEVQLLMGSICHEITGLFYLLLHKNHIIVTVNYFLLAHNFGFLELCFLLTCGIFALSYTLQIPVTYAGGVTTVADLERIKIAGMGRVDVTVGSALDIFGGNLAYKDVVAWHVQQDALTF